MNLAPNSLNKSNKLSFLILNLCIRYFSTISFNCKISIFLFCNIFNISQLESFSNLLVLPISNTFSFGKFVIIGIFSGFKPSNIKISFGLVHFRQYSVDTIGSYQVLFPQIGHVLLLTCLSPSTVK